MRRWAVLLILTDRAMNVRNGKYIERHYSDICDLSKKREDKKTHATKMKMQKIILHEMPLLITRRRTIFFTISRKHPIYRQHILSITLILLQKNFEISSEHNHARNNHAMKSVEQIVEAYRNLIVNMCTYWWNFCFEKQCPIELVGTSMESWL